MIQNKLWEADSEFKTNCHLNQYMNWLNHEHQLSFNTYNELWEWSIQNIELFWESIWKYFDVKAYSSYNEVLSSREMPGSKWFEGATLNYAEHLFRNSQGDKPAIIFGNERGSNQKISWNELISKVSSMASYFKSIGVGKGDCVVAFMPNVPETTMAFLAVNSLGAIWSSTSPDFGSESVVDRFAQIEPKVLIAVDGYFYNGKSYSKIDVVQEIEAALPSLEKVVLFSYLDQESSNDRPGHYIDFDVLLRNKTAELEFEAVDFNHPIWVLYSSGTTGLPKAIVHSHGGILLEHLKYMAFHNDVHEGELFFWYTTTGWMMWNFVQAALLMGATIVLYDGSPTYPHINKLWEFAQEEGIHHFGTSAPFLVYNMKKGNAPIKEYDLSKMRSLSSTGAPLPHEAFEYVYENIKKDLWLCSMAGGTDVCTAFVGGNPLYAVHTGEIQCRALGVSLHAYNDSGDPVLDELGEMVIEQPLPSMPIYFWNDPGQDRYRSSYFEHYPGKWRHGDFIKISSKTDGLVIYGRSDATLNRHGIRIGTSEIYRTLDQIDEIEDSLILNLELDEGNHFMPLFVKMKGSEMLSENLIKRINRTLRKENSPRHVPDSVILVKDIPYTISGKKMETPIKKILMGMPLEKSINFDSMRNPESVDFFIEFAKTI